MTDQIILRQLQMMPDSLKQEVIDFIGYLLQKHQREQQVTLQSLPKFGSAKGRYIMSADFDEPLEDFKDYM